VIGVALVAAGTTGGVLYARDVATKPLVEASPVTAAAIQAAIPGLVSTASLASVTARELTAGTDDTGAAVAHAIPATIESPANDAATPGREAYRHATLPADDPIVRELTSRLATCRTLVADAQHLLDPEKSLVGRHPTTTAASQIVTLAAAEAVPGALADCAAGLQSAQAAANTVWEARAEAAARAAAANANQTARATLQAAVDAGQTLANTSTSGQKFDSAEGVAFRAALAAATDLVAAALPSAWAAADDQTTAITQSADALAAANTAYQTVLDTPAPASTTTTATGTTPHKYTGKNGDLDPATLCVIPYDTKQRLRCDAVTAWLRLDQAYKAVWGEDIPIDLSYRTYDQQVEMKARYGSGAATPGTSNHGWATALDLPDYREGGIGLEWNYGTEKYEWLKANAPAFSWANPAWAVQGGSGPHEPWHFEFTG
jgi:LAS superfamily LD-carboxypeptidase LdcB